MTFKHLRICPYLKPFIVFQPRTTFRNLPGRAYDSCDPATPNFTQFPGLQVLSDPFLTFSLASLFVEWPFLFSILQNSILQGQLLPFPCSRRTGENIYYSVDQLFMSASVSPPGCRLLKR